jgi:hypothetical protein
MVVPLRKKLFSELGDTKVIFWRYSYEELEKRAGIGHYLAIRKYHTDVSLFSKILLKYKYEKEKLLLGPLQNCGKTY